MFRHAFIWKILCYIWKGMYMSKSQWKCIFYTKWKLPFVIHFIPIAEVEEKEKKNHFPGINYDDMEHSVAVKILFLL